MFFGGVFDFAEVGGFLGFGVVMVACRRWWRGDFNFLVLIFDFEAVIFSFLVVILCLPVMIFWRSPELVVVVKGGGGDQRWLKVIVN